jgi:hypothetical protein
MKERTPHGKYALSVLFTFRHWQPSMADLLFQTERSDSNTFCRNGLFTVWNQCHWSWVLCCNRVYIELNTPALMRVKPGDGAR